MPDNTDSPLDDSPRGIADRWRIELAASKKDQEKWKERANKVIRQYLDDREGDETSEKRLNLFYSDIQIKLANLYGKMPKVEVSRKHADADDDPARIAAQELDRMLNCDIENGGDTYASTLLNCLEDWQLAGFALAKVRYAAKFEQVPEVPAQTQMDPMTGQLVEIAPAIPAHEKKSSEEVGIDYCHWDSVRYSPCKVWDELRWIAYEIPMTRHQLVAEFGDKLGKAIKLDFNKNSDDKERDAEKQDVTGRARIWEIWCKEGWSDEHNGRKRYYFSESYPTILKVDEDPLGLTDFIPSPRPLIANATTKQFIPVPFFYFAQDLYRGCDRLFTRICLLEDAIAVRGVYDKANPELAKLLSETPENRMLPMSGWAGFSEKGGFKGAMDFVPLDMIAAALDKLSQKLSEKIQLLYQVNGMSDIMRGSATQAATATEQALKAEYGSVRIKKQKEEFSRFATDLLKLKAEIIAKHFDPESIVKYSNMANTPDAQQALQVAQNIKDMFDQYRIEVKSDEIAMPDLAAIKNEKVQLLTALSQIFQTIGQLSEMAPELVPALLEQAKQCIAAFKGAATSEGVIDRAVIAWQQKLQQPKPPDPKMLAAQQKAQTDQQKAQMDMQKDGMKMQHEGQKAQMDMAALQAETKARMIDSKLSITEKLIDVQLKRQQARDGGKDE